jgi:hypothetical protein
MIIRQDFLTKSSYLFIWFIFTVAPTVAQITVSNDRTIDASKYPSLQAAIDALPVTGGVIIIPPGDLN